jgi:ATP-dependent protease ClpP protease subunit
VKKINIKGPIISSNDQWIYDWFGIEAVSPSKVDKALTEAGEEDLEVIINSGGGSVFDASDIYTALKSHSGNVEVKIVGIAASAASVIAMAGNSVKMAPTAQMMIHNASMVAAGDYRDLNHSSNFLQNVNQTIASAYKLKSGKEYEELLSMMDDETWLTPQQALENQLIDGILFAEEAPKVVANQSAELLPPEVIEKVRNGLMEQQRNQVVNNVVGKKQEGEGKPMNLEQLKNDHPELYKQVKDEGHEEGVKAENARIKAIEELGVIGSEELVTKAKFETKASAESLAVDIIKAQKEQGFNFLKNREADAEELNNVEGSHTPENNGSDTDEEAINVMAAFGKSKRGGRN